MAPPPITRASTRRRGGGTGRGPCRLRGTTNTTQPGAGPYFDYFGALAGERGSGYYAYSLGAWRLYALNSNIPMDAGSPQETWLRLDLAANPRACVLAYWHHPRFSAGKYDDDTTSEAIWRVLYDAKAEVVLNGHDHDYQRYAPMSPAGAVDQESGIREFVVGTGGNGAVPAGRSPRRHPRGRRRSDHRRLEAHAAASRLRLAVRLRTGQDFHRQGIWRLPLRATASGLAIAALAALAAPAAAAAPRITLAPAAGPPGSAAVLRGAAFSPRSAGRHSSRFSRGGASPDQPTRTLPGGPRDPQQDRSTRADVPRGPVTTADHRLSTQPQREPDVRQRGGLPRGTPSLGTHRRSGRHPDQARRGRATPQDRGARLVGAG